MKDIESILFGEKVYSYDFTVKNFGRVEIYRGERNRGDTTSLVDLIADVQPMTNATGQIFSIKSIFNATSVPPKKKGFITSWVDALWPF